MTISQLAVEAEEDPNRQKLLKSTMIGENHPRESRRDLERRKQRRKKERKRRKRKHQKQLNERSKRNYLRNDENTTLELLFRKHRKMMKRIAMRGFD